jgi:hypothetical protein
MNQHKRGQQRLGRVRADTDNRAHCKGVYCGNGTAGIEICLRNDGGRAIAARAIFRQPGTRGPMLVSIQCAVVVSTREHAGANMIPMTT